jgi:hypothetical protein
MTLVLVAGKGMASPMFAGEAVQEKGAQVL